MVLNGKSLKKFLTWKAAVFVIPFVFTFCTNNMENMYLATASYAALPTGTPIDSDNDGKIDGLDITGDSIIDMTFIKPTSIPATGIDITGNGQPDFYLYQTANGSTFNTSKDGTGNTVTPIVVGGVVQGYDTTGDSIPDIGTAGSTLYKVSGTVTNLDINNSIIVSITVNSGVPEYLTLSPTTPLPFKFNSSLTNGQYFEVKVVSPGSQQCTVSGGTSGNGTGIINKNNDSVAITCGTNQIAVQVDTPVPATFTMYVSLLVNGTTTVTSAATGSSFPLNQGNLTATFNALLQGSSTFTVSILTSDKSCKFVGANSGVASAALTTVHIKCASYIVGNSTATNKIANLDPTSSITLGLYQNGSLVETQQYTVGTTFTFTTTFYANDSYQVSIVSVNTTKGDRCKITANSAGIISANVTGVDILCAQYKVLWGAIAGLTGNVTLSLSINGTFMDSAPNVTAAGNFTQKLFDQESYNVQILATSVDTCKMSNNIGTIGALDATVTIICSQYQISGTLNPTALGYTQPLTASLVASLYINGTLVDTQIFSGPPTATPANTAINFNAKMYQNDAYSVTISSTQFCRVTNGSGVFGAGNVTNLQIECAEFQVSGLIKNTYGCCTNISGTVYYELITTSGSTTTTETGSGTLVNLGWGTSQAYTAFSWLLLNGDSYSVIVTTDTITGTNCTPSATASGTIAGASVTNAHINCP